MTTIEEHQKRAQALIKKIRTVAFIIAGIMIVVVVYTSISKLKTTEEEQITVPSTVKQKSEQSEEQREEQPEKQLEEITPSVKIESASAKPSYCYEGMPGEFTGCDCVVKMSGTATLPITEGESGVWYSGPFSLIFLRENPLTANVYGGAKVVGESLTCPWYSNGYSECIRTRGQPATGKWSITVETGAFRDEPAITYFAVVYSYQNYKPIGVWDSATITCPGATAPR
jgi:hypothetical protein